MRPTFIFLVLLSVTNVGNKFPAQSSRAAGKSCLCFNATGSARTTKTPPGALLCFFFHWWFALLLRWRTAKFFSPVFFYCAYHRVLLILDPPSPSNWTKLKKNKKQNEKSPVFLLIPHQAQSITMNHMKAVFIEQAVCDSTPPLSLLCHCLSSVFSFFFCFDFSFSFLCFSVFCFDFPVWSGFRALWRARTPWGSPRWTWKMQISKQ